MLDFDHLFSVQQLLEPSLPQLVECLSISGTSMATLQIFVELCSWRPGPFTEHVTRLKSIIEQQPHCLALALQVGDYHSVLQHEMYPFLFVHILVF